MTGEGVNALRIVFQLIGLILTGIAVFLLGSDLFALYKTGAFQPVDTGSLWFSIHKDSLQLAEPAIARYLHPWLWHPLITTMLLWPAFVVIGAPGVLLLLLTGRSPRRKHRKLFLE